MNPMMLQALIRMLQGQGGQGAPGMTGQAGGAPPMGMAPPMGTPTGGPGNPMGGLSPLAANLGPNMASPPPMPTPAPNQGLGDQPPTGGTDTSPLATGAVTSRPDTALSTPVSGGEPTESGRPAPGNAIPPIPRSPLGALLMPQGSLGGGVPPTGPTNPYSWNNTLGGFLGGAGR